jgi:hypothetical protein
MKLKQWLVLALVMAVALGAAYGVVALGEAFGMSGVVVGVPAVLVFWVPVAFVFLLLWSSRPRH